MKISKYFSVWEVDCSCGCDMSRQVFVMAEEHAQDLDKIREYIGKPIHVNSWYRCEDYNRKIGGATKSKHRLGIASDLRADGMSSDELYNAIQLLIDEGTIREGGLGLYNSFVHYDTREYKARWVGQYV